MYKNELNKWLDDWKQEEAILNKRSSRSTTARTITALIALAGLIFAWKDYRIPAAILTLAMIVLFSVLVARHQAIKKALHDCRSRKSIVKSYLARSEDRWAKHALRGQAYAETGGTVAQDLDLFGDHSLYGYLCLARTNEGRRQLADWLCLSNQLDGRAEEVDAMRQRQEAVRELAEDPLYCVRYLASGPEAEKEETRSAEHMEMGAAEKMAKGPLENMRTGSADQILRLCSYLFPAISILSLIGLLFGLYPVILGPALGISFAIQLILYLAFQRRVEEGGALASSFLNKLALLNARLPYFSGMQWNSAKLCEIQHALVGDRPDSADRGIRQLARLDQLMMLSKNQVLALLLNGLLMWDVHLSFMGRRWRQQYGAQANDWLFKAGEMEALISLATPVFTRSDISWPVLKADEDSEEAMPHISFRGLRHPLIPEQKGVGNDLEMGPGIVLLTGSNMSGKTTMMRTVGISLVLAYAGAPVTGDYFEAGPLRLFTSMRVGDDIGSGESTFYAELQRIRQMIGYGETKRPMIALIDEIFKGTNSADRIVGAEATLRHLARPWMITMVSTHDFELCDLEHDPDIRAKNYHFTEHYVDDRIGFDYLLKPGRCLTTNARYLLRMAGILDEEGEG